EARAAVARLAPGTIYPRALKVAARLQVARCHETTHAMGAAIAELQEALELDSKDYAANLELGRIYLKLKKPLRAIPFLARAVKGRPAEKLTRQLLLGACQGQRPQPVDCKAAVW
ncbi:MAG: hypothetical protein KAI47_04910, partial [Deltaproteobacteria bacterium]|nr:hypothetical protein [Deltaproteobacteria bacterium]